MHVKEHDVTLKLSGEAYHLSGNQLYASMVATLPAAAVIMQKIKTWRVRQFSCREGGGIYRHNHKRTIGPEKSLWSNVDLTNLRFSYGWK